MRFCEPQRLEFQSKNPELILILTLLISARSAEMRTKNFKEEYIMFVPLSDCMACNRFVGTALYERAEEFADQLIDKLCEMHMVSDSDLAELEQGPVLLSPFVGW